MERNNNDIFDELVRGKLSNYSEPPEPEWIHSVQYKKTRAVNLYHLYRFVLIGIIVGAGIVAGIMMTPAQLEQLPTVQSQTSDFNENQSASTTDFASVTETTADVTSSTDVSNVTSSTAIDEHTSPKASQQQTETTQKTGIGTKTVAPSAKQQRLRKTSFAQPLKNTNVNIAEPAQKDIESIENIHEEKPAEPEAKQTPVQTEEKDAEASVPCKAEFDFYTSYSGEFNFVHLSPIADKASITWDFGDGSQSEQRNGKHRFEHTGSYEVTLTVTNQDYSCSFSKNIAYQNPNEKFTPILLTGQVVAGSNLLKNAIVELYAFNDEKGRFKSVQTVRTNQLGEYSLTLQRNTRYIVRGYPTSDAQQYLATFWGNTIESEDASEIMIMPSEEEQVKGYTVKLMLDETELENSPVNNPVIPTTTPQQVFLVDANNTIISVGTVDENGNVSFGNDVPDGNYNLVDPSTGASTPTTIAGGAKVSGSAGTTQSGSSSSGINSKVTVYPNPANSIVNFGVNSSQQETATMVIMDAAGVERYRQQITFNAGLNQYDLSSFSPGVYYLMIFRANQQVSSSRIVKLADTTK